jgi:hypothetical protein
LRELYGTVDFGPIPHDEEDSDNVQGASGLRASLSA